MLNKFEIEFKGTMAEFTAWMSETFQNADGLQITVKVEMPVSVGPQSPLTRALARMGFQPFPRAVMTALEQHRQKNEKIQVIKLVRTHTGLGLREAKDFAEAHIFQ